MSGCLPLDVVILGLGMCLMLCRSYFDDLSVSVSLPLPVYLCLSLFLSLSVSLSLSLLIVHLVYS